LGARKPQGQNRVDKSDYGHLWLREENLSFNNNDLGTVEDTKLDISKYVKLSYP